mgnify:CR=1 FL=1
MDDVEIKARAEEEQNRLIKILKSANVSERRMMILSPVIVNTAWMKAKLDDARDAIKNSQIAISYDNGGGQKGIRENPLFKGYESLWRSYIQGVDRILSALPDEAANEYDGGADKPKTVLELIQRKHRADA